MIKQKYGDRIDGWIHTGFPFLFVRPLDPNLLTVIGTLGSIAAAAALASGWLIAGGVLILASGFFDLVDGVVARHRASSTRFGAFLDSTLDRFSDMAVLVGFATHFALMGRPGCVLLAGSALIATVMVSYSAACAKLSTSDREPDRRKLCPFQHVHGCRNRNVHANSYGKMAGPAECRKPIH